MPPPFERMASVARSVGNAHYAHAVTIYPVRRVGGVNSKPQPVLADAYPTQAAFYRNSLPDDADAQPMAGGRQMLNRAAKNMASITLVAGRELKADFFMVRDDGRIYQINGFDPDDLGGVMATVSEVSALPEFA